jgi:hypothetical protein
MMKKYELKYNLASLKSYHQNSSKPNKKRMMMLPIIFICYHLILLSWLLLNQLKMAKLVLGIPKHVEVGRIQ